MIKNKSLMETAKEVFRYEHDFSQVFQGKNTLL